MVHFCSSLLLHFVSCWFYLSVLGLARAAFFGTVIVSAMELFSVYGIETITIITLVPFGIGTLISAPLSGKNYSAGRLGVTLVPFGIGTLASAPLSGGNYYSA